jgi:hypothetical protein
VNHRNGVLWSPGDNRQWTIESDDWRVNRQVAGRILEKKDINENLKHDLTKIY